MLELELAAAFDKQPIYKRSSELLLISFHLPIRQRESAAFDLEPPNTQIFAFAVCARALCAL